MMICVKMLQEYVCYNDALTLIGTDYKSLSSCFSWSINNLNE